LELAGTRSRVRNIITFHCMNEEVVLTLFQQAGFTILEKQNTSATVSDTAGHTVSGAVGLMFVVAKAT